ncbi:hypothetical protein AOLI_G00147600 [Acnodon oligacanthus]
MVSSWGEDLGRRGKNGKETREKQQRKVLEKNSSGFEGGHFLPACGTCRGSCETSAVLKLLEMRWSFD